MQSAVVLCLFGLVAVAVAYPGGGTYTARYDNLNLDEILSNPTLLIANMKCLLDEGKCTAEAKELKSHMGEALQENCAKCTPAQRQGADKVIGHLMKNEPGYWGQLKAKYDPTGKYSKKYEAH